MAALIEMQCGDDLQVHRLKKFMRVKGGYEGPGVIQAADLPRKKLLIV